MKSKMLTNEQICSFCAALEQLTCAGIGLGDALVLLKEDEKDPDIRQLLGRMARQADEGASLSAALGKTGRFPAYVSTLTAVGELSGKLEQTLEALACYYENRERMDRHMRAALVYPAALLAVLLAVALTLVIWVLPIFNDVYAHLGSDLTGVAGALLSLGKVLRKSLPAICVAIAVFAGLVAVKPLRQWALRQGERIWGDRGARRAILSARFMQALSLAVSSGMPAPEALELACALAEGESPAFRKRCEGCMAAVAAGTELAKALRENGFLSPAERRILDAGMRSGKGEAALQRISRRMLEQGEEALDRRSGRVEPAVVAIACVLIGATLLSVMLPLMDIMAAIG